MDELYKQPRILHLDGVKLTDHVCPEDLLQERLMAEVEAPSGDPAEPVYRKIPEVFTSVAVWPLRSNLLCWECDQSFAGPPKFVPTYIAEDGRGELRVGVEGNFCGFNCVALWITTRTPPQNQERLLENLLYTYYLFTGVSVLDIRPAISKTETEPYGGSLTKSQWWEANRALDPRHGLQNHTSGTIPPERERAPGSAPGWLGDARLHSMWGISLEDYAVAPAGGPETVEIETPERARAAGVRAPAGNVLQIHGPAGGNLLQSNSLRGEGPKADGRPEGSNLLRSGGAEAVGRPGESGGAGACDPPESVAAGRDQDPAQAPAGPGAGESEMDTYINDLLCLA